MGLRLPDGPWLSILSGWRRNRVTYVDLQMNDTTFKKESISAVMRAFMLEHEIARSRSPSTLLEDLPCCSEDTASPSKSRRRLYLEAWHCRQILRDGCYTRAIGERLRAP